VTPAPPAELAAAGFFRKNVKYLKTPASFSFTVTRS
jgi:hypothetical protein